MESDTDKTDEVLEYHTDANEQETIQNEIVNEANFLLGANSQFGRPINLTESFLWKFLKADKTHDSFLELNKWHIPFCRNIMCFET